MTLLLTIKLSENGQNPINITRPAQVAAPQVKRRLQTRPRPTPQQRNTPNPHPVLKITAENTGRLTNWEHQRLHASQHLTTDLLQGAAVNQVRIRQTTKQAMPPGPFPDNNAKSSWLSIREDTLLLAGAKRNVSVDKGGVKRRACVIRASVKLCDG